MAGLFRVHIHNRYISRTDKQHFVVFRSAFLAPDNALPVFVWFLSSHSLSSMSVPFVIFPDGDIFLSNLVCGPAIARSPPGWWWFRPVCMPQLNYTHTRTNARTHARTHAHTHTHTHTHKHTQTHTNTHTNTHTGCRLISSNRFWTYPKYIAVLANTVQPNVTICWNSLFCWCLVSQSQVDVAYNVLYLTAVDIFGLFIFRLLFLLSSAICVHSFAYVCKLIHPSPSYFNTLLCKTYGNLRN